MAFRSLKIEPGTNTVVAFLHIYPPVVMVPGSRPGRRGDATPRLPHPFRGAAPERVAMLGPEEAEMTDFGCAGVGRGDGQDFRPG